MKKLRNYYNFKFHKITEAAFFGNLKAYESVISHVI